MYGSVDQVAAALDRQQWDPAEDEPSTADVTAALESWSQVLDGEIGHIVSVPVSASTSPNLHAICARVTALRVEAEVWERGIGGEVGARMAESRRRQAQMLISGIQKGAIADGTPLGGRSPESAGAPVGSASPAPTFTMGQKF